MKVTPNQSLLDVILQGCGTLEAGMQVAADNGLPLSYMPAVDSEVLKTDAAGKMQNAGVLKYLVRNGILIGTSGSVYDDDVYVSEDDEDVYVSEDGTTVYTPE